ncbi:hypothetical protein Tco_0454994 [Tanacetum coccineum]
MDFQKLSLDEYGYVLKNKARLVAKGYRQESCAKPTEMHLTAIKRIFHTVKRNHSQWVCVIRSTPSLNLQAIGRCRLCRCHDTTRSTSGSSQFLGPLLASSKKQKSTAISTTEAEYIAHQDEESVNPNSCAVKRTSVLNSIAERLTRPTAYKSRQIAVSFLSGCSIHTVIIDPHGIRVKFLALKDEAPDLLIKFLKMIRVRLNAHVRNIRTDNGTEFVNQTLRSYYESVGISHETSVVRSPQQKGVVERQNHTLVEVARIISRLVANLIPQQPCNPPPRDDWDHLFQHMFDEYFNPSTIAVSPVPVVAAPRAVDSPMSMSIDQDAPSTRRMVEKCVVEIQGTFLVKICDDTFNGNVREKTFKHIDKFLEIVGPIKINGLTQDRFRLSVFPVSLAGAASEWFTKECIGSITTWDNMVEKFILKFHHLSDHNEEEETEEDDNPNKTDNVPEIFKIEGNLFDFETPLCEAFHEFNCLLKLDTDLFTYDIQNFKTYDEYTRELNNDKAKGELSGMVRVGSMTYFQDHRWYNERADGKLKDETLALKAKIEGSWGDATPGVIKFCGWLKSCFENFHELDYEDLAETMIWDVIRLYMSIPSLRPCFEESPKTPHFYDDPLHESLHEDSTSQGSSSNVRPIDTPFESLGRWTMDHPIENVIGDPSHSVSTRKQLQTDAMWCYFDAFLTLVEPKNFKQAMTEPSGIDAMQ